MMRVRSGEHLRRCWNWKAAITSATVRGVLFFAVNLGGGLDAARAAFLTEFLLRAVTSGFYGAMTQAFCRVQPRWIAMLLLPLISHGVEWVAHWLRGTEALVLSIGVSALFTIVSTAFNLHAMRNGVLVVGRGSQSFASDLQTLPSLLLSFIGIGLPRVAARWMAGTSRASS